MLAANICGATLALSSTKFDSNSDPELIPCFGSLEDVGSSSREEVSRIDELLMESILFVSICPESPLLSFASSLSTFSVGYWTGGKTGEEGKTIAWPLENSIDRPVPFDVCGSSGIFGCNEETRFEPLEENSTDFIGFSHFLEGEVVGTGSDSWGWSVSARRGQSGSRLR